MESLGKRVLAVLSLFLLLHAVLQTGLLTNNARDATPYTIDYSDFEEDENSDINLKYFTPPMVTAEPRVAHTAHISCDMFRTSFIEEIPTPPPLKI